jgi:hypothetical protein
MSRPESTSQAPAEITNLDVDEILEEVLRGPGHGLSPRAKAALGVVGIASGFSAIGGVNVNGAEAASVAPISSVTQEQEAATTVSSGEHLSRDAEQVSASTPADTHTIQEGDTFWDLGGGTEAGAEAWQAANPGVNPERLPIGHQLNTPGNGNANSAPATFNIPRGGNLTMAAQAMPGPGTIDQKIDAIVNLNGIQNPDIVQPGPVRIPGPEQPAADLSTPPAPAPAPAPTPEAAPAPTGTPSVEELRRVGDYVDPIVAGDNEQRMEDLYISQYPDANPQSVRENIRLIAPGVVWGHRDLNNDRVNHIVDSIREQEGRRAPEPQSDQDWVRWIAEQVHAQPEEVASLMVMESGLDPTRWGGDGGNYYSLIQFGPDERESLGIDPAVHNTFEEISPFVVEFLRGRGFDGNNYPDPGERQMRLYATVLGGNPNNTDSVDSNGTSAANTRDSMTNGDLRRRGEEFLAQDPPGPTPEEVATWNAAVERNRQAEAARQQQAEEEAPAPEQPAPGNSEDQGNGEEARESGDEDRGNGEAGREDGSEENRAEPEADEEDSDQSLVDDILGDVTEDQTEEEANEENPDEEAPAEEPAPGEPAAEEAPAEEAEQPEGNDNEAQNSLIDDVLGGVSAEPNETAPADGEANAEQPADPLADGISPQEQRFLDGQAQAAQDRENAERWYEWAEQQPQHHERVSNIRDVQMSNGETITVADVEAAAGPSLAVHIEIADEVANIMQTASDEGQPLGGWGYRTGEQQIELRREHCGTSDYAINEMPSSQCSPPTARPGRSMHEQGLAVDFNWEGDGINSRDTFAWEYMNHLATANGLQNLESEPWHYSTNGN